MMVWVLKASEFKIKDPQYGYFKFPSPFTLSLQKATNFRKEVSKNVIKTTKNLCVH